MLSSVSPVPSASKTSLDSTALFSLATAKTFSSTAISSDTSDATSSETAKAAPADNIITQSNTNETIKCFALIFSPQLKIRF